MSNSHNKESNEHQIMTYGNHIVDAQAYYSERFREADEQLDQYPVLRDVFGTVSWSEYKDVRNNPVLLWLSHENTKGTQEARLSSIEYTLEEVIPELNSGEERGLKNELTGDNRNKVMSKVLELIYYYYFDFNGFSVEFEPSLTVGGETDLRIDDQSQVYLEITRMGTSAVEASIENVYESVAEQLSTRIPGNKYLRLDVNTNQLVWNTQLDQPGSERTLLDHFDSAHISTLLQHRDEIILEDFQGVPDDWTLEEVIKHSVRSDVNRSFGGNWKRILNDPKYEAALQTKVSEFKGPITSAMWGDARSGLVELHSEMNLPSHAARHQERIFLDRIERKIDYKIDEGQREPNKINILLISASFWLARGYTSSDRASLGMEQRSKIQERIRNTLDGEDIEELVGVVMIEDNLTDTVWINNSDADPDLLRDFRGTKVYDLFNS